MTLFGCDPCTPIPCLRNMIKDESWDKEDGAEETERAFKFRGDESVEEFFQGQFRIKFGDK